MKNLLPPLEINEETYLFICLYSYLFVMEGAQEVLNFYLKNLAVSVFMLTFAAELQRGVLKTPSSCSKKTFPFEALTSQDLQTPNASHVSCGNSMYTKEELESMEIPQLMGIAEELGVKVTPKDELQDVVYAILDKAAEDSAANATGAAKRKRTRIAKKENNRVYSVTGADGENFDVKAGRQPKPEKLPLFNDNTPVAPENAEETQETEIVNAAEQEAPNTQEEAPAPEEIKPAPKKRGRKSKAEKEAEAARLKAEEEAKAAQETSLAFAEEGESNDTPSTTPMEGQTEEFQEVPAEETSNVEPALLEQLQQRMAQHNQTLDTTPNPDGVWGGDPGDGTDFITVVDIPIEDREALPVLDMFDRPMVQQPMQPEVPVAPRNGKAPQQRYDFADIIEGTGVLELLQDGYGFLRSSDYNYLSSPDDIYVSAQQVKKYSLKTGDVVECTVRPPHDNEKYFALSTVRSINGRQPAEVRDRVSFEHLTPLFPDEKFTLCGDASTTNPSVRIVDLFSPIGKGQRALIVAQPKTGKTILMKDIANAIAANHPEAYIMMLLIDERPEEVTDMSRTVNAEVIASTFDEPADRHVKIAGIVLEKAKRMVECGHDVVIFLDSITRLARAYNTVAPASGKVLTGGVDANALQKPKRFFGAARNIEGGGSLTIIATALVDTGSKMDEVIFEEFKGTGNSEIQLNRQLSNKRIFPAIDLVQSSTRRDDLLQDQTTLNRMWVCRKFIAEMTPIEAMDTIRDRLVHSQNNEEFLLSMNG